MALREDRPDQVISRIEELTTILSMENVTPLLQKKMEHAITLHVSALQHSHAGIEDQQHEDLTRIYKEVVEHWTKTYRHMAVRATLLRNIDMFQRLLALNLLGDYAGESYELTGDLLEWTREQWATITRRGVYAEGEESHDKRDEIHKLFIITPCEEMMIDYHLVEPKICSAAEGQHPGGDDQHFIKQRDWLSLATALFNDRQLATDLFMGKKPVGNYSWGENIPADILRRINELQSKYFEVLLNPASFTLTKYAEGLSAQVSSSTSVDMSSSVLAKSRHQSWTARAKGLYNYLTGGLRDMDTNAETTAEPNSM